MKLSKELQLKVKMAIDAINDVESENATMRIDFYQRAIGHLQDVVNELKTSDFKTHKEVTKYLSEGGAILVPNLGIVLRMADDGSIRDAKGDKWSLGYDAHKYEKYVE